MTFTNPNFGEYLGIPRASTNPFSESLLNGPHQSPFGIPSDPRPHINPFIAILLSNTGILSNLFKNPYSLEIPFGNNQVSRLSSGLDPSVDSLQAWILQRALGSLVSLRIVPSRLPLRSCRAQLKEQLSILEHS